MSFEIEALQQVWMAQPTPELHVDMHAVRRDADRFRWKIRLRNATEWVASLAVAATFAPLALGSRLPLLSRVSCVAIVLAAIYISWKLFRDGRNRAVPQLEDATQTYVRAYRDDLLRQAELLARVPRWYLGPLGVALAGFHAGFLFDAPHQWPMMLVVFAFTAAVFVVVALVNKRGAHKLRTRALALDDDLEALT